MKVNWKNDNVEIMTPRVFYLCKYIADDVERLVVRFTMHDKERVIYFGSDGYTGWDEYHNFTERYTLLKEVESIDVKFY